MALTFLTMLERQRLEGRDRELERFLHSRDAAARRLAAFLRALSREGEPDLAGLTLAVRQLRTIVD
jgi:glutamate dehydrogenase